jgi:hypothetical protein
MAYLFKMENINDYCDKCKSKPCPKPCRFVDEILALGNRAVMENHLKGDIIQNFPEKRMVRFTELEEMETQDVIPDSIDDNELYEPLTPQHKNATVFYLRFFKRLSYEDIAVYIDSTPDDAAKYYHAAKNRIIEIISFLDRKGTAEKLIARKVDLTENEKMFVCKVVLGLTALQISKLYGGKVKPRTIEERVRKLRKRYKAQMTA